MDSRKDARAATAGSILITRLEMRGCAGVVTDGGFRDAEGIGALDIPAYHTRPSAPTNLTLHEAIEINGPIGCLDAAVFPGSVIVGDGDGVIVIPAHLADEIAGECAGMEDFEAFVLESVCAGHPIIGLYPPTQKETEVAAWLAERKDGTQVSLHARAALITNRSPGGGVTSKPRAPPDPRPPTREAVHGPA